MSHDDDSVNYAYHLDATLYAQFLRRFSENLGVQRIEGKIVKVHQAEGSGELVGFIAALRGEDGELAVQRGHRDVQLVHLGLRRGVAQRDEERHAKGRHPASRPALQSCAVNGRASAARVAFVPKLRI